jgi:hypothetical protein
MRRSLTLATILIAVIVIPGFAQGKGAVKTAFDPDVGWAIVNTTASGHLNVNAHVDNGRPNREFTVSVRIRYADGTVIPYKDIGILSTNGQGNGNFQGRMDIDPPADSDVIRRVAVRVRKPGPPNIVYVAVAWDVPLK